MGEGMSRFVRGRYTRKVEVRCRNFDLVWFLLLHCGPCSPEIPGTVIWTQFLSKAKILREGANFLDMGDHLDLYVDQLVKPKAGEPDPAAEIAESSAGGVAGHVLQTSGPFSSSGHYVGDVRKVEIDIPEEEEPLIQTVECRICQEEDSIKNLDTPCACSGSLKYAHRACVQRWVNEKGDLTCEICHEPYKHGYVAPPRIIPDETAIDIRQDPFPPFSCEALIFSCHALSSNVPMDYCSDMISLILIVISGGWAISGTPFDLHDPRLLAMAAAQRHFLEAEYDEYAARNASGAAFCRSAALILMALLLLRHALTITNGEGEDDASTFFSLFLLRAAGFLLPCYIMAWAISILQRRRQRQEAAELAASEVAFILQSGQARGLQFAIAPESPATPQQEPHQ
ncbi:hypothetical protein Taro_020576 [Colocasia esculenta]|uniref:RING-CH-type domain-containing protein n=1 Tax=Colocasia esculenta TaxID=4460 RepID=A0A843V5M0_COLES|nr:hypothetical protein [Colocasia esculenta]